MSGVEVSIGFRWDTCNNLHILSVTLLFRVIIDLFENFRILWFLFRRFRSRPWGKREGLSYRLPCRYLQGISTVRKYDKRHVLINQEYIM